MSFFELLFAFGTGMLVGALFFGNLRWSINHMGTSRFPVMIYGTSLLLRMLLVFVLAFWALQIGIVILLFGLAGFTIARVIYVTRTAFGQRASGDGKQVGHG